MSPYRGFGEGIAHQNRFFHRCIESLQTAAADHLGRNSLLTVLEQSDIELGNVIPRLAPAGVLNEYADGCRQRYGCVLGLLKFVMAPEPEPMADPLWPVKRLSISFLRAAFACSWAL